jgi:hypothetical protein
MIEGELLILETQKCKGENNKEYTCFALESNSWSLGNNKMNPGYKKIVHINPSIPYMYLPIADFA